MVIGTQYKTQIKPTGCAKKKKDNLNIYVKSQIINIFFFEN